MWSGSETDVDFLNYSEVAEMVSDLLSDKSLLPLSLGIFGGWGTGKSSTLCLVEQELNKSPDEYLVVKFDAWLYQNFDDARAALMSVISEALRKNAPASMKGKVTSLIGRVNKLRALSLALEGGAFAMGMPRFGAITIGVTALRGYAQEDTEDIPMEGLQAAGKELVQKSEGLLNAAPDETPPQEIDAFRREFGEILESMDRTLVVFIDNCPSSGFLGPKTA